MNETSLWFDLTPCNLSHAILFKNEPFQAVILRLE